MKRLLFIGVYFFFVFALSAQNNEISTSQIVDLGLSVKWAGWNIGASAPEQYGGLYGWADPSGKKVSGNENEYPSENPPINICGTKYDIAYIQWGKDWRLPTIEEMQELMNKCKWKWISYRKTNGYKVTGPNGNSIFLPAGGRRSGWLGGKILQEGIVYDKSKEGYYITGSSYSTTHNVPHLYFHSGRYDQATDSRSLGYSVRPVMGTSNLAENEPLQNTPLKTVQLICQKHTTSIAGEAKSKNSYNAHKINFELFKNGLSIKVYEGGECHIYKVPKGMKVYFKYVEFSKGGGMVEKLWFLTSTGITLEYYFKDLNDERITIRTPEGEKTVHYVNDAYSSFLDLFVSDETMFELIRAEN